MIQLINYSGVNSNISNNKITVSKLTLPSSLDGYKFNIIDLGDSNIWMYDNIYYDIYYNNINIMNDLINLGNMVRNAIKTKVIIMLPQDLTFKYNFNSRKSLFNNSAELRNIIEEIRVNILNKFLDIFHCPIYYEPTKTNIDMKVIDASFYFKYSNDYYDNVLTKSISSDKITTLYLDKIIATTLNLQTDDEILSFLKHMKILDEEIEVPNWIKKIKMFDDEEQQTIIEENKTVIKNSKDKITDATEILNKNNEYKSILYTNGDHLVNTTFDILEELLNYDLFDFKDEKKEDFLIKFNDITFIGEIKGVNTNVRSEHISQVDVHLQTYLDDLAELNDTEINEKENVKSILIINHQRKSTLLNRQPVHENQIKLAKRNESLIIETYTLLKIFESFRKGKIDTKKTLELFKDTVGLLEF